MSEQKWTGPRMATRADIGVISGGPEIQVKPGEAFKQRRRRERHIARVSKLGVASALCAMFGCDKCHAREKRLREYLESLVGASPLSQDWEAKRAAYLRGMSVVQGGQS